MVLTLGRLNWQAASWCEFKTRSGVPVDVPSLGARSLKMVLGKAARVSLIQSVGDGRIDGLDEGPLIEPIVELLGGLRSKGRRQAAAGLAGIVARTGSHTNRDALTTHPAHISVRGDPLLTAEIL